MSAIAASILLVLMAAAVIAWLVMFVVALVEIIRHRRISGGGKVVWVLITFAFPILARSSGSCGDATVPSVGSNR
jgi:hypothetical protein